MTWAEHHAQSEQNAALAEIASREGNHDRAAALYRLAAQEETLALSQLGAGRQRTFAITAVSAASLWFKARDFDQAQLAAYRGLATGSLPAFASNELQRLLQEIWSEQIRAKAGIAFTRGEVIVSVSGGEVVTGGAPLQLVLQKVDGVSRLFFRTIEVLLNVPFRRRGAPSEEIQEQFRPWLFQAAPSSYQFAVRVERPRQMALWPEAGPSVEQITGRFLDIVRASVDDPKGALVAIVPDEQYRDTFLKLTRNLAPTGRVFGRLEIKTGDAPSKPIVLLPVAREAINQALRKPESAEKAEQEVHLHGVLRGLQLDSDWIEINTLGEERKTIRVFDTGEVIDDVVGPMVNHRVIVSATVGRSGRYTYRDMQPEE